jgi:hypothetical protein
MIIANNNCELTFFDLLFSDEDLGLLYWKRDPHQI